MSLQDYCAIVEGAIYLFHTADEDQKTEYLYDLYEIRNRLVQSGSKKHNTLIEQIDNTIEPGCEIAPCKHADDQQYTEFTTTLFVFVMTFYVYSFVMWLHANTV